MQRLVCRVGGTLQLDDDIRIVVHGRLRERVTFGVVAPWHRELVLDGVALRPAPQSDGGCWYLFSLLNVRAFLIGEIEVRLSAPDARPGATDGHDAIHLDIIGAESVRLLEVEARAVDDASARRRPAAGEWLEPLQRLLGAPRTA